MEFLLVDAGIEPLVSFQRRDQFDVSLLIENSIDAALNDVKTLLTISVAILYSVFGVVPRLVFKVVCKL